MIDVLLNRYREQRCEIRMTFADGSTKAIELGELLRTYALPPSPAEVRPVKLEALSDSENGLLIPILQAVIEI